MRFKKSSNNAYVFNFECVDLTFFFRILGNFLRRIGCQPVTNFPNGIDISDAGDILVGDSHGNQFHVAVYDRRGDLVSQFQCPQVNISGFYPAMFSLMGLFIRRNACFVPNSNCRVRLGFMETSSMLLFTDKNY